MVDRKRQPPRHDAAAPVASAGPAGERGHALAAGDLPLAVALERPDMVGIDRLLDAVAANRLRRPEAAAVLVDVGTAITVDLVAADGDFRAARSCRASPCRPGRAHLYRSVAAG